MYNRSVSKVRGKSFGFVAFNTIEERDEMKPKLTGEIKGTAFTVKDAIARDYTKREKKRKYKSGEENEDERNESKKRKTSSSVDNEDEEIGETVETVESDNIVDVATPLHNLKYEDQLIKKSEILEKSLIRITRRLRGKMTKIVDKQGIPKSYSYL